ncbi:MAG: energy transducer TonB [Ignavibacteriales bacterium]|nr:energy transducer TonB [Ignavibacteriales bacterium]
MFRIAFLLILFASIANADILNSLQKADDKMQGTEPAPVVIKRVNPDYPDSARISGIEGMVYLQVFIGEKGFVKEVKVQKNDSGSELLEIAAMKAALDWQFEPVIKDGKAVGVYVTLPFNFKLSKEGKKK